MGTELYRKTKHFECILLISQEPCQTDTEVLITCKRKQYYGSFVDQELLVRLPKFETRKCLYGLNLWRLDKLPNQLEVKHRLIDRGKRLSAYVTVKHVQYCGFAFLPTIGKRAFNGDVLLATGLCPNISLTRLSGLQKELDPKELHLSPGLIWGFSTRDAEWSKSFASSSVT